MAEPIIPDALSSTNDTTTDETTIQSSLKPRSFSETKEDDKEKSNVSESVTDSEKQLDINETEPPDGGLRAWLVVVGVCSFNAFRFLLVFIRRHTLGILRHLCDVRVRERLGSFPSVLPGNSSFYDLSFNNVSIVVFNECFVSDTNTIERGSVPCKYVLSGPLNCIH